MFCKDYKPHPEKKNGKQLAVVSLVASAAPITLPENTEGIDGIGSEYIIAPGSSLFATDSARLWIMNDEYEWDEQI